MICMIDFVVPVPFNVNPANHIKIPMSRDPYKNPKNP
jgi:hypothetical protein